MLFDPDEEPWRSALILMDDVGSGAMTDMRLRRELLAARRQADAGRQCSVLLALLALGPDAHLTTVQ